MDLLFSNLDLVKKIFNSKAEGVVVQDSKGAILDFNDSVLKMLGVSADELIGKTAMELPWIFTKADGTPFPESERPPAITRKTKMPVNGCIMGVVIPGRTARWFSVSSDYFQHSKNDFFVVITFIDVTELKSEHEFAERVVKTSPIIKVATDLNGNITLFNPAAERAFGYLAEDVMGVVSVSKLFESSDIERYKKTESARIYGNVENADRKEVRVEPYPNVGRFEAKGVRKNGSIFIVELSIVTLLSNVREMKGYLYNAIDITERKKAAEILQQTMKDLERSNLELERFAYVASHDLQAPLRHISSYVDLLQSKLEVKDDSEAGRWMNYIVDGTQTMKDLIGGLLAYSRVSGSQRGTELVDLNIVWAKISTMLRTENPDVIFESQSLPTVAGNHAQLYQLFQNLMHNAVKFRRSDIAPKIQVSVQEKNDDYYFEVKDNGIGIQKEHFDRVFQLFQRLHSKEKYEGTGIGLSVCQKIVNFHGGKIWIESSPGNGTNFCFTLKKATA